MAVIQKCVNDLLEYAAEKARKRQRIRNEELFLKSLRESCEEHELFCCDECGAALEAAPQYRHLIIVCVKCGATKTVDFDLNVQ